MVGFSPRPCVRRNHVYSRTHRRSACGRHNASLPDGARCGGRDRADERIFLCAPDPASRQLREAGSPHGRRARSRAHRSSRRRSRGVPHRRLRRRSLFSPRPGSAPRVRTAVRRARGALGSASRPRRVDGFPRLPASVGCGGRSEARVLHRGCAACAPLPRSRRRWRRSRACALPRVCRFRSRRSRPERSRSRRGAVSAPPRAGRSSRRLAARAPRRVLQPPWSRRVVVPVLGVAPRSRSAPSSPAPRARRHSRRVARARSRVCPCVSLCVPAVHASPVRARTDPATLSSRCSAPSRSPVSSVSSGDERSTLVRRRARGRRTVTSVPDSSFAVGLVGLLHAYRVMQQAQ